MNGIKPTIWFNSNFLLSSFLTCKNKHNIYKILKKYYLQQIIRYLFLIKAVEKVH